jgi:hypothetical protein
VPPARYKLCWEAEGWLPGCWQKLVSTADGPAYVPPIGIKPARSEGRRAVAGRVLLGDGKPCRFVDIRAGIDLTAEVHAVGPAGRARRARANSLGYYVVPDASAGLLQLLASCRDVDASRVIERVELASAAEGAPRVYFDKDVVDSVLTGSGAETLVFGPAGPDLVVDFQIANRPPRLLDIIIVGATGGAGRAAPGETVILRAAGGDATPTALFWTVPGGEAEIVPDTGGTALEWVVPETQGQYRIEILGGDGFGGWGRAVETIEISDSESLRFGGRVFAGGKPAAPADVRATVNGRMLTVAAGGFFSGLVPPRRTTATSSTSRPTAFARSPASSTARPQAACTTSCRPGRSGSPRTVGLTSTPGPRVQPKARSWCSSRSL